MTSLTSSSLDIRGRFRNGPNQCGGTVDSALAFIPDLNEVVVAGGDGINNHLPMGWGSGWVQEINVTTSVVRALPNLPRATRGCRLAHQRVAYSSPVGFVGMDQEEEIKCCLVQMTAKTMGLWASSFIFLVWMAKMNGRRMNTFS